MAFPNLVKAVSPTTFTQTGSGTAWDASPYPLSNIGDGNWNNQYYNQIPAGQKTKNFDLQGFDLSWFDSANFDLTGVGVLLRAYSTSFSWAGELTVDLLDNTGTALGVPHTFVPTTTLHPLHYGVRVEYFEITEALTPTQFDDPDFGLRLIHDNSAGGSASTLIILELVLIPLFKRKEPTNGAGVIEIKDAAGNDKLSPSSALTRWIDSVSHDHGWTGTITDFTNFNDNSGMFVITSHMEKVVHGVGQKGKTFPWASNVGVWGHGMELPRIDWSDTTKEFVVAASSAYPLPSGWTPYGDQHPGWTIIGLHYK